VGNRVTAWEVAPSLGSRGGAERHQKRQKNGAKILNFAPPRG